MELNGTESYKHSGQLEPSGLNLDLETDFPDWNVHDYPQSHQTKFETVT